MNGGRLSIALCAAVLLGALGAAPAGAIGFLDEWGGTGSGPGELRIPRLGCERRRRPRLCRRFREQPDPEVRPNRARSWANGAARARAGPVQHSGERRHRPGRQRLRDRQDNPRVEKFDAHGTFLIQWGSRAGPGAAEGPGGDRRRRRGQRIRRRCRQQPGREVQPGGAFLTEWGTAAEARASSTCRTASPPTPPATSTSRTRKTTACRSSAATGAFIAKWGSRAGRTAASRQLPKGERLDAFDFPVAVATDSTGRVFVADADDDRVEKFTGCGEFLTQWGGHGEGPGPVLLAARRSRPAADGKVYVADAGNDRIEVFGRLPGPRIRQDGERRPGQRHRAGAAARQEGLLRAQLRTAGPGRRDPRHDPRPRAADIGRKNGGGGSQGADFFDGTFKVLQPRGGRPVTVLKLENPVAVTRPGTRGPAASALAEPRPLGQRQGELPLRRAARLRHRAGHDLVGAGSLRRDHVQGQTRGRHDPRLHQPPDAEAPPRRDLPGARGLMRSPRLQAGAEHRPARRRPRRGRPRRSRLRDRRPAGAGAEHRRHALLDPRHAAAARRPGRGRDRRQDLQRAGQTVAVPSPPPRPADRPPARSRRPGIAYDVQFSEPTSAAGGQRADPSRSPRPTAVVTLDHRSRTQSGESNMFGGEGVVRKKSGRGSATRRSRRTPAVSCGISRSPTTGWPAFPVAAVEAARRARRQGRGGRPGTRGSTIGDRRGRSGLSPSPTSCAAASRTASSATRSSSSARRPRHCRTSSRPRSAGATKCRGPRCQANAIWTVRERLPAEVGPRLRSTSP